MTEVHAGLAYISAGWHPKDAKLKVVDLEGFPPGRQSFCFRAITFRAVHAVEVTFGGSTPIKVRVDRELEPIITCDIWALKAAAMFSPCGGSRRHLALRCIDELVAPVVIFVAPPVG